MSPKKEAVEEKVWLDAEGYCVCLKPKCHHRWKPQGDKKPMVCPRCKSYKWFVPAEAVQE